MKGERNIIKIALVDSPQTFNPLAPTTIWDESVVNLIYDPLARSASKEPYHAEPCLAKAWQSHMQERERLGYSLTCCVLRRAHRDCRERSFVLHWAMKYNLGGKHVRMM